MTWGWGAGNRAGSPPRLEIGKQVLRVMGRAEWCMSEAEQAGLTPALMRSLRDALPNADEWVTIVSPDPEIAVLTVRGAPPRSFCGEDANA